MLKVTEDAIQAIVDYWKTVTINGVPRDDHLVKIDAKFLRKLAEAHALEAVTALPAGLAPPAPVVAKAEVPVPFGGFIASHRTGTVQGMTKAKISKILGFKPNGSGDGYKVKTEWLFTYKGHELAIWDYKGSASFGQFSTYGPKDLLTELFGADYVDEGRR